MTTYKAARLEALDLADENEEKSVQIRIDNGNQTVLVWEEGLDYGAEYNEGGMDWDEDGNRFQVAAGWQVVAITEGGTRSVFEQPRESLAEAWAIANRMAS